MSGGELLMAVLCLAGIGAVILFGIAADIRAAERKREQAMARRRVLAELATHFPEGEEVPPSA